MNLHDAYSELGLKPDASDAAVKAAWRRAAARWHPDRNASPQALRRIQRINQALEAIRQSRGAPVSAGGDSVPPEEPDPSTMAADFAGGEEAEPPGGAAPLHHTLELTLEQAIAGCVTEIRGELVEDCSECGATGVLEEPGACAACDGSGRQRPQLWFAWMASSVPCRACSGEGRVRHRCPGCRGSGQLPARHYRCRVRIPPGAREGDLLHVAARLPGPRGQRPLDLAVRVHLKPHELFTVQPDGTVECELPVDGFAWVANRWIDVPTPGGLQQMRLRRDYLVYRIKGQGFFRGEGDARADCIVTVVPLFPPELGSAQEALVERLIATNTRAAGTAAAERMAEWARRLDAWQARRASD